MKACVDVTLPAERCIGAGLQLQQEEVEEEPSNRRGELQWEEEKCLRTTEIYPQPGGGDTNKMRHDYRRASNFTFFSLVAEIKLEASLKESISVVFRVLERSEI